MKKIQIFLLVFSSLIFVINSYAQNPSDYLVCQDIGGFKKYGCTCGSGAGILGPAGHFGEDHKDISCDVTYHSMALRLAVKAEVTQHSGSESDKWLLHEVERGFRDSDNLEAGPAEDTMVRDVDGNKIFFYGGGVVGYRWISNNIVVNIQYTNLSGPKPEPLEIIQAYLQKHPSTITLTDTELKSTAHNEKWIKNEMDRRLWLGGKWMGEIKTAGDLDKLRDVVKNLNVFLDYREKYYGIEAKEGKKALYIAEGNKDKTAIEAKLNEYYKWWSENKDKPINLS